MGVKNKNIRMLCGKPLIAHSLIQAKKTNLFSLIAVSSDSSKILQVSKKWGAQLTIQRPLELATSIAPKLPAIQHAVHEAEKFQNKEFDYVVDLDATAPLRTVEDILASFNLLREHLVAENLVTACIARKSPYFNMLEISEEGFAQLSKKPGKPIYRRQDVPLCYDMNASIYIWKRNILFNSNAVITNKTLLYIMPENRSVDIDTEYDFQCVKWLSKDRKDLHE